MEWQSIVSIGALLAALTSLAGMAYGFGFKWGEVKSQLKGLSEAQLLTRLTQLETKQEVLWQVFAEDVIHGRPRLGATSSPYHISPLARQALDEVKRELKPHCKDNESGVDCLNTPEARYIADKVLVELPHRIGLERLRAIAHTHNMSLAELLAIVTSELRSAL